MAETTGSRGGQGGLMGGGRMCFALYTPWSLARSGRATEG